MNQSPPWYVVVTIVGLIAAAVYSTTKPQRGREKSMTFESTPETRHKAGRKRKKS
jgi:hypothetical protein